MDLKIYCEKKLFFFTLFYNPSLFYYLLICHSFLLSKIVFCPGFSLSTKFWRHWFYPEVKMWFLEHMWIKVHPNPSCFILISFLLARQKVPNLLQSIIGNRRVLVTLIQSWWNGYLTHDLPRENIHTASKIEKS